MLETWNEGSKQIYKSMDITVQNTLVLFLTGNDIVNEGIPGKLSSCKKCNQQCPPTELLNSIF